MSRGERVGEGLDMAGGVLKVTSCSILATEMVEDIEGEVVSPQPRKTPSQPKAKGAGDGSPGGRDSP